jgi:hypothetical protein
MGCASFCGACGCVCPFARIADNKADSIVGAPSRFGAHMSRDTPPTSEQVRDAAGKLTAAGPWISR